MTVKINYKLLFEVLNKEICFNYTKRRLELEFFLPFLQKTCNRYIAVREHYNVLLEIWKSINIGNL